MSQTATAVTDQQAAVDEEMRLDPADRCERCSARAWVRVEMPDGSRWQFCAHDYQRLRPGDNGLDARGAHVVVDQRDEIP